MRERERERERERRPYRLIGLITFISLQCFIVVEYLNLSFVTVGYWRVVEYFF